MTPLSPEEEGMYEVGRSIADLKAELARTRQELAEAQKVAQSKHDYGPASAGEQEAGWQEFCRRYGWNPNNHPSAKSAYVEGYCDGDSYSEGDESRQVLRQEVATLQIKLAQKDKALEKAKNLVETMETCHACHCVITVPENAIFCIDCSSDCEFEHEGHYCNLNAVHREAKEALAKIESNSTLGEKQ